MQKMHIDARLYALALGHYVTTTAGISIQIHDFYALFSLVNVLKNCLLDQKHSLTNITIIMKFL
jgi:hypothetical protein